MDFVELKEKAERADFNEKYRMLRSGTDMEKLAAIPHFDTLALMETLKDSNSTVRLNALVQIRKLDELYEIARGHANIAALAYDASPSIRQEVMNVMNEYSGRLSLAKDNGNPACDAAYWEFVRAAEKLAVDPVPEIANMAQEELERHYDRYPWTRPQEIEVEKEVAKDKGKGMDI